MKTSTLTILGFALATATCGFGQTPEPTPATPAPAQTAPITPPPPPTTTSSGLDTAAGESPAGFYIGAQGGVFWLKDFTPSAGPMSVAFTFKSGGAYGVPFGYDFGNGFKLGLSVSDYKADFNTIVGTYEGASQQISLHATDKGSAEFVPVMLNASYSVQIVGGLHWNIGAGIGAVHENVQFLAFDFPSTQANIFGQLGPIGSHPIVAFSGISNQEWDFGFQGFTGLSYEFTPNFSIEASYHYIQLGGKVSISGTGGSVIDGISGSSVTLRGQTVEAGLVWKF